MERIAIVGAGGVGGLLGVMLGRAGHDVRVLARGAGLEAIRRDGLRSVGPDGEHTAPVSVVADDPRALGEVDVVLVAVKTWQLPTLAPRLAPLVGRETAVIPLLNGVEAADILASTLDPSRVLGGFCHMLSWLEAPGRVRWAGAPPVVTVGCRHPEQRGAVDACVAVLQSAHVDAQLAADFVVALWSKMLFIAPFGAVGAASGLSAGPLRRDVAARAQLSAAMEETRAVAVALGVALPSDAVSVALQRVDALPDSATSSLQRDVMSGRRSEADELIGAIVRLGAQVGVQAPVSGELHRSLCERASAGAVAGGEQS